MHINIVIMATKMGIEFYHSRMEQAKVGGMRRSMGKSIDMTVRDLSQKMKQTRRSLSGLFS